MELEEQIKKILSDGNKFSQITIKNYSNNIKKLKELLKSRSDNIKDIL